jgi:phosphoglycolate phosphatase-like HAD superfamily hydrolase
MIILENEKPKRPIRAVLLDFDGTISTLRSGWEEVMRSVMLEMIAGDAPVTDALRSEVDAYIDASTGIQTIFQMQWLCEYMKEHGLNKNMPEDPWWYKDIYNERLMQVVDERKAALADHTAQREQFLIAGSEMLLKAFRQKGLELYVASGTDDEDVAAEVGILGLMDYFSRIAGAGYRSLQCSKERTLRDLLQKSGFDGDELLIMGDGKVEIALGREIGAWTIGTATDETRRRGINPAKQVRLKNAGAHVIIGDYLNTEEIIGWMGI